MQNPGRLPPIWVMGVTNATFGLTGGFCVVTIPAMLATHGVPEGHIAAITSAILSPGFWVVGLSPLLDFWLSRRTYALIFAGLTAIASAIAVAHPDRPGLIEAVMVPGYTAAVLYQGAVGGWMGSLIEKKDDSRLGIWFTVSNTAAGGLMMALAGEVLHRFTNMQSALMIGALTLLPLVLFPAIPSPPDRRLVRESFVLLGRAVASLFKQREVLLALVLFIAPVASFALTNVLGGVGKDFSASERAVGLLAGLGSVAAGLAGSFLLFPLARRFALRPLYLGIGVMGGLFTLGLLLMPHNPWTFGVAITGENLFQALAFAASNAITFEVIGPDNPLAATLFILLVAVGSR